MERPESAQCAVQATTGGHTAELENVLLPIINDEMIQEVVLHRFTQGLQVPQLNSLDMEKFISDPRRCSKEVRQEVIVGRNAPSLTEIEYDTLMEIHEDNEHNKELEKRPICTICQEAIERPVSPSSEERTDNTAVKLVAGEGSDSSAYVALHPCDIIPHVFHLGCIRDYFFHDQHTETVKCPNCCNQIYNGQGGYQRWDWSFVMDSQTGEYVEYLEPDTDGYSDEEDDEEYFFEEVEQNYEQMVQRQGSWETWPNDDSPEEMDASHEVEDKANTSDSEQEQSNQTDVHPRLWGDRPHEDNPNEDSDVSDEAADEGISVDPLTVDLRRPLRTGENSVLEPFPQIVDEPPAQPEGGAPLSIVHDPNICAICRDNQVPPGGPMQLNEFKVMLANSRGMQGERNSWGRAKLTAMMKERVVQELYQHVHGMPGDFERPTLPTIEGLVEKWCQKHQCSDGLLIFDYEAFSQCGQEIMDDCVLWRFLCPEWADGELED